MARWLKGWPIVFVCLFVSPVAGQCRTYTASWVTHVLLLCSTGSPVCGRGVTPQQQQESVPTHLTDLNNMKVNSPQDFFKTSWTYIKYISKMLVNSASLETCLVFWPMLWWQSKQCKFEVEMTSEVQNPGSKKVSLDYWKRYDATHG